jgi:hypothetical protein
MGGCRHLSSVFVRGFQEHVLLTHGYGASSVSAQVWQDVKMARPLEERCEEK